MQFSPEKARLLIARQALTQDNLSKKADLPLITVTHALRGTRNPSLRTIGKLARGLGVDVTEIIVQEGA